MDGKGKGGPLVHPIKDGMEGRQLRTGKGANDFRESKKKRDEDERWVRQFVKGKRCSRKKNRLGAIRINSSRGQKIAIPSRSGESIQKETEKNMDKSWRKRKFGRSRGRNWGCRIP